MLLSGHHLFPWPVPQPNASHSWPACEHRPEFRDTCDCKSRNPWWEEVLPLLQQVSGYSWQPHRGLSLTQWPPLPHPSLPLPQSPWVAATSPGGKTPVQGTSPVASAGSRGYVQGLERDLHLPPVLGPRAAPLILRSHTCPQEMSSTWASPTLKQSPPTPISILLFPPLPGQLPSVVYILENQHLSALWSEANRYPGVLGEHASAKMLCYLVSRLGRAWPPPQCHDQLSFHSEHSSIRCQGAPWIHKAPSRKPPLHRMLGTVRKTRTGNFTLTNCAVHMVSDSCSFRGHQTKGKGPPPLPARPGPLAAHFLCPRDQFFTHLSVYEIALGLSRSWASPVAKLVKHSPAMRETWVQSLGCEDPLEKGTATHSSILAWRIPWTVQPMGSRRVAQDWENFTFTFYMVS